MSNKSKMVENLVILKIFDNGCLWPKLWAITQIFMPLLSYYIIIGYYELTLIPYVIMLQMRGLIMLLKAEIMKELITVILIAKMGNNTHDNKK